MSIEKSLFDGDLVCLAPIDFEKDPEIESRWTHNAAYLRLIYPDAARPLSPWQVKKRYEAIEKEMEDDKNLFHFTIRLRADDRLLGFGQIYWVEWANAIGSLRIGIGDPDDRGKGYGSEALQLLLRYAFDELNLYRLGVQIGEYNPVALHVFRQAGFVEEVRRRQALNRDGRRWDLIHLGLLRSEWSPRPDSLKEG
jgi:RimJ/RimL family protein N-acetyltransferase